MPTTKAPDAMSKRPPKPKASQKKKKRTPQPSSRQSGADNRKKRGTPRKNRDVFGTTSKGSRPDDATFTLHVTDIANGGYALGRYNRRTVLIPYAIPGEKLRARIRHSERTVDFAEGVQLLSASADRVYPECEHFGEGACWGCQWQHIDYRAQQLLKQDILLDQVQRFSRLDDKTLTDAFTEIVASPVIWHYSYQMLFERVAEGGWGIARMDGRSIQAITRCQVMRPELQALYDSLDFDFPQARRLQLQLGSDGATMLNLTLEGEDAPELTADIATSINVILPDNEPVNLVGDSALNYRVGDRDFRVTAGGYFRANIPQIDALIGEVLTALQLQGEERVLDLYAGAGVFSAFLAPRVALVTLVESYPPLVSDADVNLADFDNVDVVEGSVGSVLEALNEADEPYDVALLDPPANGLGDDVKQALTQMKVGRLAYISSNPATLGRDLADLMASGYRLKRLQPFDFAPHTYYVDAFALLERDA